MKKFFVGISLIFFLAGCGPQETAEPAFFPLNEGWHWTYKVTTELPDAITQTRFSLTNRKAVEVDGLTVVPRRSSDGTDYYILATEKEISRVGKRTLVQSVINRDPEPRTVLPLPHREGIGWGNMTPVFLLQRKRIDSVEEQSLLHESPVLMNFFIEETGQSIKVPAGEFEDCLKVVGQAEKSLFADAAKGFVNVPITQTEWYCKNVGLVKLERAEPLNAQFFTGGRQVFELLRIEQE